jgi:signal transduction histidine kinase
MTGAMVALVSRLVGAHGHRPGLWAFAVGGLVLWMLSGRLARRLAHPLYELLRVTQEIGAGRLSARARLPYWRVGEIALLARAINDMAARIERQIADQRELLAGVSHEIRTPLARIRVLLELARDRAATDAPAAVQAMGEIEREVLEIDALVGELLASARLDFAAVDPRPLDAVEVARRALERAGAKVDTALAVEQGGDLRFEGDPTLIARALANLLDNARRHGGGVERLRVRARPGSVIFEVEDSGPGFPTDGARPEKPEGSLGLGLVLVRRIADVHKGSLHLSNRPEGGARATLELGTRPA